MVTGCTPMTQETSTCFSVWKHLWIMLGNGGASCESVFLKPSYLSPMTVYRWCSIPDSIDFHLFIDHMVWFSQHITGWWFDHLLFFPYIGFLIMPTDGPALHGRKNSEVSTVCVFFEAKQNLKRTCDQTVFSNHALTLASISHRFHIYNYSFIQFK